MVSHSRKSDQKNIRLEGINSQIGYRILQLLLIEFSDKNGQFIRLFPDTIHVG